MRIRIFSILVCSFVLAVSCSKGGSEPQPDASLTLKSASTFTFSGNSPKAQTLSFRTNTSWTLEVPESASSWLKAEPLSGTVEDGSFQVFNVTLTPAAEVKKKGQAYLNINYADKSKSIKVVRSILNQSSDYDIPDDMIFSTTLGGNSTNVAQGFDYDPATDMMYVMSKYGTFRNMIGWQKRSTASSTSLAPSSNRMQLNCFCHGNNICIQPDGSSVYVWAPNYGTRQEDGSYDSPAVVSRFPLAHYNSSPYYLNTEPQENYYFGIRPCWPAFDFENDLMAICNYKTFYIYRLSELMALPDQQITLDYTITYGGSTPVDTKREEYTGKPTIKAKDCRKVKPLYTVTFDYGTRGLHWQSYCINDGWVFAILQADKKEAPDIIFDTYVEAYKMDGTKNLYKIRQEYMQNRDRIVQLGWTENDYFYCEPEGIRVRDGVMYTLYAMRKQDSSSIRWPIVFQLESPVE